MNGNTMKTLISMAFVVASTTTPIFAGELDSFAPPATPLIVLNTDVGSEWAGFYVGGDFLVFDGSQTYTGNTPPENFLDGTMLGGFAGFNFQSGQMVYGAEASYGLGSVSQTGDAAYQFTDILDVKARLGVGVGDALVYGLAGWSNANWDDNGTDLAASGFSAGLGVDYQVSDGFFVGVEYLYRNLVETQNADFAAPLRSVQVRAGLKF